MNRSKIAALALAGAFLLSSCAWFSRHPAIAKNKHEELFVVTADKTEFFRDGPQQGRGADRELQKDTMVTVIRHAFGYSKVRLTDGQQGFVANDSITHASRDLVAQNTNDASEEDHSELPPPPEVKLPTSDPSPDGEPTPFPQPLIPQ